MGNLRRGWSDFRKTIMWTLLARQRIWFLWLVVTASGAFLGAVGTVDTIRKLVDEGVIARSQPVEEFVGVLVFLAFWSLLFGFLLRQVISRIGYHLEFELRIWLYERLQSTDPRRLDALATGQMVTRAMTDLQLLELVVVVLPTLAVVGLVLLGLAAVMVSIDPLLSLVTFLVLPANLAIVMRIRRALWGMSWVTLDRRARVTTAIDESVRGARVVKAFGREDHERRRLAAAARDAYAAGLTRVRLVARYDLILNAIPAVVTAALVYLGTRRGVAGVVSVGDLLLFFVFALVFTNLARSFGLIQSAWQFAKTGAGRIFELIAFAKPATTRSGVALPAPLPAGDPQSGLRLDGATVRIHDHPVLAAVTFRAGPGQVVVVSGPPRSGKTTLARLVAGGQGADGGTVAIDGVDLVDLDPVALRRAVRVVAEDPFLFGRSVRENLLLGAPEGTTDAELWAALGAAGASQVVEELPLGLDTVLGDRGLTVSGGQRQRLALACALVDPPRVLVLDDALSAVDPALETAVLGRVRDHAPATAVVAITRRPSATAVADGVVELPPPGEGAPRRPRATGSLATDGPYDLLLAGIVAQLPPDRDEPVASEEDASKDDEVPTVPGILRPHLRQVGTAALLLLLFTFAGLVPTWMIQVAMDAVEDGDAGRATIAALGTLAAAVVVAVAAYGFRIEAKKVEEGVGYVLRRRASGRLLRLGVDFYDRELPGRVAARVVHDLDQIAAFLETGVYELVTAIALLAASFTVIAVWEPSVALAVGGAIPLLALLTVAQLRPAGRAYQQARAALGDVVARLQEDFAGRHVIEALGAEEHSRAEFVRRAFVLRQARRRATTIANSYIELMQWVAALAAVMLLRTASDRVFDESLSVGGMVALQLFLTAALAPIPTLSGVLQRYLAARASFRTLGDPFRAPVRPTERPGPVPCPGATGDVVLDGVAFTYPDTTRQVLGGVDLTIPAGATVAVVGPTGAGKSSIAKLVARVYDPDGGTVRVGGTDVRDWDLVSYRRRIGIVPQDGFCFRGTVAENIAYGRPDAPRDEIEAAARAVGAYDAVLGLVGGLDARVEEEGRNLTAAQVQLLALARAWLCRPDLLILDEATSSLDPETEQHVLDATRAMDRTTIMITHRLPVAQAADLVVVVADGSVVEQGRPADLKQRTTGAYAALWEAGPEVDARVAGTERPEALAEARAAAGGMAANGTALDGIAPVYVGHRLVRRALDDLGSGALGATAHALDRQAAANGAGDGAPRSAATAALAGKVIGETDEELVAFLAAAGGVEVVAQAIFEALRAGVDPAAVGSLAIAFEVGDGNGHHRWVLVSDPDATGATLERAAGDASLTLRLEGPDLLRLAIGQLDPIEGVMTGRIALSGDLEQVARLGQVFAPSAALVP